MDSRRFVVTVKAARNLAVRDRATSAGTYAVLCVPQAAGGAVRLRTKPSHKTTDPVWTSGVFDVFALAAQRHPRAHAAAATAAPTTPRTCCCLRSRCTGPCHAPQKRWWWKW